MTKSEVGSNIAQTDSKWSLIVLSSDILIQFSQTVDQNRKLAKSEVGSNMAKTDSKWSLIVIPSDILIQFSQNVDQNGKMTPNGPY